jgi:hypothetical protein
MITVARKKLQQLWRGDEGVALAMFIIVCPTLLLIAFSAFQLGEVVRQRIILQNATDAGAYAGAVVQADALSRLGVLNEAMAWTYVQGMNLEQDLLVGDMLTRLIDEYNTRLATAAANTTCTGAANCPHGFSTADHTRERLSGWPNTHTTASNTHWGYYVGVPYNSAAFTLHGVYLNGDTSPGAASATIEAIQGHLAAADSRVFNEAVYVTHLGLMRNNLDAFKTAEDNIVSNLRTRIEDAVDASFMVNAPHVDRTTELVKLVGAASSYTTLMTHADETNFVNSVGGFTGAISSWWDLNTVAATGISRYYNSAGAGNPLEGWFQYGWRSWTHPGSGWPVVTYTCEYTQQDRTSNTISGAWNGGSWGAVLTAYPYKLTQSFIGPDGTIVVGAKCRIENPFVFSDTVLVGGVPTDLDFSIFTAPFLVNQDIWCASAARAGLRDLDPAAPAGQYSTLLDVTGGGVWNLYARQGDWDAVMLPLNKAWKTYNAGNWSADAVGNRAQDVLTAVYTAFPADPPLGYTDDPAQWALAQSATFH